MLLGPIHINLLVLSILLSIACSVTGWTPNCFLPSASVRLTPLSFALINFISELLLLSILFSIVYNFKLSYFNLCCNLMQFNYFLILSI